MNIRERLFIPIIWNKRKNVTEKVKDVEIEEQETFTLELTKYNASLLICALAFVCRYMYYGKVEKINIEDFIKTDNFNETFYDLRLNLWVLHGKAKKHFPDYKEFTIYKK